MEWSVRESEYIAIGSQFSQSIQKRVKKVYEECVCFPSWSIAYLGGSRIQPVFKGQGSLRSPRPLNYGL